MVAEHIFRTGQKQVGESFLKESSTFMAERDKVKFEELNAILGGSDGQLNLEAALKWANENQGKLDSIQSSLLFKLKKVGYLLRLAEAVKMWQTILDL